MVGSVVIPNATCQIKTPNHNYPYKHKLIEGALSRALGECQGIKWLL